MVFRLSGGNIWKRFLCFLPESPNSPAEEPNSRDGGSTRLGATSLSWALRALHGLKLDAPVTVDRMLELLLGPVLGA